MDLKLCGEVVVRTIAGETLLIPTGSAALQNSGLITLNETGKLLVERLQEGSTDEALISALTEEYDVTADQAGKDVARFLNQLRERGLL